MQIEAKLPKYFDLYTLYLFSFCNTIYFSVTCYYFLIFSSYSASDHLEHCVLNVTLVNIILFCLKTLSLSMLLICVFLCVWLVIWTGFQTKGKKKSCFFNNSYKLSTHFVTMVWLHLGWFWRLNSPSWESAHERKVSDRKPVPRLDKSHSKLLRKA